MHYQIAMILTRQKTDFKKRSFSKNTPPPHIKVKSTIMLVQDPQQAW